MLRITPPATIGIIGGGQLGKMMAYSLIRQGYKVAVLDPDMDCPCAHLAHHFICASYSDENALRELAQISDVITYEFENIDVNQLMKVSQLDQVPQGYDCLRVSQDRLLEKSTIQYLGIPTIKFEPFSTMDELNNLSLNYPIIIKTRRFGYDGKGQISVKRKEDLIFIDLDFPHEYIAEELCLFDTEISVIACGYKDGIVAYEPFENNHINGILHTSLYPAQISKDLKEIAIEYTKKIIETFNYKGILAIEFFVKDNQLYFNELAPRPHNSGHGTIDSCDISQFDSHIYAITGCSKVEPKTFQVSLMQNILGQDFNQVMSKLKMNSNQSVHVHLYGKKENRDNRKIGHITFTSNTIEQVNEIAQEWRIKR